MPFVSSHVYVWCMARSRTNIEIDDDRMRQVMDRYGVSTKTEAVDLALRHLVGQPMSRSEALAMRGARAIRTVPVDRGPGATASSRRRSRKTGDTGTRDADTDTEDTEDTEDTKDTAAT
jgi:Arc/MetJ family transcription regulator